PGSTNCQKKANQWRRWSSEVIPLLLPVFHAYLHLSESLQLPADLQTTACPLNCECEGRMLSIACILFDRMEHIDLWCCSCTSAPSQLLSMGLFACAPVTPSLAVDLQVLNLVRALFVHMSPNTTTWCEALEAFLSEQGYQLNTKVSCHCTLCSGPCMTLTAFTLQDSLQ
ncbi:hypothetical protein HYDPIDRAFT_100869, partial [Hydnomerulius pinastri MD-312]